jgi:hypothetical protein
MFSSRQIKINFLTRYGEDIIETVVPILSTGMLIPEKVKPEDS